MRHLSIPIIALSLATILLSSCASRKTAATLNDVETYIKERPDSALATIRAIDTTTLTTRSLRAHYALLHAMALDKNWIDTTDLNVVMPAVEYYDRHPSGIRRAKAWYYLGRIQQNGNDRQEASISFLKSERYAEASDDYNFKGLICMAMSTIYSQTHLYEEALEYTNRAYLFFEETRDTLNANSALFCMAKDYNNLERYDESDSLYLFLLEGHQIYSNLKSDLLCSHALNCVTNKEDYAQAITYFEEALSLTGSLPKMNFWGAYAYALSRTGNEKRADRIFDIQDNNVREVLKQSAVKAQKDFLEQMNLESESSAKKRQILLWCFVALLLAVILLLLFLFRRRKERSAQEKEELIDAYKSLTMEHSVLSSRYSDLSAEVDRIEKEKASVRNKYIQLCQSHFKRIGRINEVLYYHSSEKDNKLYSELKRSIRNIGMDNKSQSEFELLLNESFDNVMVRFRETFPDKKPRYYQLVSYLFAGFGSSTICVIIPGFQKHNVHVERYRLKQMIQNSDSQYKELFLRLLS